MKFGVRHIRHFIAVAEELHFRRAAERLHIAQPALSRSIKHLETQIGLQLLDRNNRNVMLTNAGTEFLKGCRGVLDSMEGMVTQARKASVGEVGHLIVGYTDFAISGRLPQLLQDFRSHYPQISIEPVHGFTGSQLEDMESGTLDFGFITGPFKREEYTCITVQSDQYVAVLYENHPLAGRSEIDLGELAGEQFILGDLVKWQHYHDHLLQICRSAGFTPNIVQQAFNLEGIFGLIACEMGVTIQPACVNNYIRKGLVVIPIKDIDSKVPTLAAWKNTDQTPTQKLFANFIDEHEKY